MAHVAFPNVGISQFNIGLRFPSQSVFRSYYEEAIQVKTAGVGVWTGSFDWAERSRSQGESDIRQIEAFLSQIEGAANTFDIPMPVEQGDRFPDGTDLRISAVVRVGSSIRVTCNQVSGIVIGDYITIDNYLFQAGSSLLGGSMLLAPYRPIDITVTNDDGDVIGAQAEWAAPYLRARRIDGNPISGNRTFDWAGPWSIPFEANA